MIVLLMNMNKIYIQKYIEYKNLKKSLVKLKYI